jgi:hypothetical protein
MADYMASRNFIDIPQIVEEYQAIKKYEHAPSYNPHMQRIENIGGQMVQAMLKMG